MLILLERSSAVLAKVSSKSYSCLSAVVDARLVDIRMGYNLIIRLLHQQGRMACTQNSHTNTQR